MDDLTQLLCPVWGTKKHACSRAAEVKKELQHAKEQFCLVLSNNEVPTYFKSIEGTKLSLDHWPLQSICLLASLDPREYRHVLLARKSVRDFRFWLHGKTRIGYLCREQKSLLENQQKDIDGAIAILNRYL